MQVRNGFIVVAALGLISGSTALPVHASNHSDKSMTAKTAADAYAAAWNLWNKGEGAKTEELLKKQAEQFPQDAALGLFLAASVASHSPNSQSDAYFSRVVELGAKATNPAPESLVAQYFLHLSDPDSANEAFANLAELAKTSSKSPVVLWLYAQAAERMEKPELAEGAFSALLKKAKNAPAVVRQGYADSLEAQGKHFPALEHRLKIAAQESTPWALHALSANLRSLARYSEAARVASLSTSQFPGAPQGWHDLGIAATALHRPELAARGYSKAAQVAQTSSDTFDHSANLLAWASCLESQKRRRSTVSSLPSRVPARSKCALPTCAPAPQSSPVTASTNRFLKELLSHPERAERLSRPTLFSIRQRQTTSPY